jgi:hypothetical protein
MNEIWECWSNDDGAHLTFIPASSRHKHRKMLVGAVHLYSLKANSYNEAQQAYHEIQGWEPYVPMK